ncbi:MAG: hypothetical protein V6Z89_03440 [Desulfobacter sp.]
MTVFRRSHWVTQYFGNEAGFSNALFKFAAVLIVAQQIYYPQPQKYLHLALVLVYMAFVDLFSMRARPYVNGYLFLASALACSLVTVADHMTGLNLERVYLMALALEAVLMMQMIYLLIRIFRHDGPWEAIDEKHAGILAGRHAFLRVLLYGMAACLALAVGYIVYLIFIYTIGRI